MLTPVTGMKTPASGVLSGTEGVSVSLGGVGVSVSSVQERSQRSTTLLALSLSSHTLIS